MRIFTVFIIFFLSFQEFIFPQGEIDDEVGIVFRNERTFGLLIKSTGWGVNFRYAQRRDGTRKKLYTIDISELKDAKEVKSTNPYSVSSNRFVYGKAHFVMTLKAGIGKQKEVFQKRDKGGISIRYFYTYGPTVAFMKPIYYEVNISNSSTTVDKKFNTNIEPSEIYGRASVIKGIDEMKISPGAFLKAGFTFEFSKKDERFNAVEVGSLVEGYFPGIEILSSRPKKYVIASLFISYRFGKVIRAESLRG